MSTRKAKARPKGTPVVDPMAEWRGMPECRNRDLAPARTINVHFASQAAVDEFSALIGQRITPKAKSLWHPAVKPVAWSDNPYVSDDR